MARHNPSVPPTDVSGPGQLMVAVNSSTEVTSLQMRADVCGGHAAIRVNERVVPLRGVRYEAMALLIDARLGTASGIVVLDEMTEVSNNVAAQTVRRVRQDIDAVCGRGVGKELIVPNGGAAYSLTLTKHQVAIWADLIELSPFYLPIELAERLIAYSAMPE